MKNSTSLKSKIIAIVLAAITSASALSMPVSAYNTSAPAAKTQYASRASRTDGNEEDPEAGREQQKIADKIANKIKSIGIKVLSKSIEELFSEIPGGKIIAIPFTELLSLGMDKEVSTSNLAEKLESARSSIEDHIDENTSRLIDSMKTSFTAGTYGNDMKSLMDTYEIEKVKVGDLKANIHNLTEEEKLVKLASAVGNASNWSTEGQLIKKFKAVTSDLMGKNYLNKDDLFTIMYKNNTQNYMFSGEVYDAIAPYIVSTLADYYEVSVFILSSLNAQKMILSPDFDSSKIHDANLYKQYTALSNSESTIEDMKIFVQQCILGQEFFKEFNIESIKEFKNTYDSVLAHYAEFAKNSRTVFINRGTCNISLSADLNAVEHSKIINGSERESKEFGSGSREGTNKENFEKILYGTGTNGVRSPLSKDQLTKLVSYTNSLRKADGSKYTLTGFLGEMGFNVAAIPKNSYYLTGSYYEYDYTVHPIGIASWWKAAYEGVNAKTGKPQGVLWKDAQREIGSNPYAKFSSGYMLLFKRA